MFVPLCPVSLLKNTTAGLQAELQELRSRFEESLSTHESAKGSLTEQLRELNQHREQTLLEVQITSKTLKLPLLYSPSCFNVFPIFVLTVSTRVKVNVSYRARVCGFGWPGG